MATYFFETMTAAQALPFTPNDHLVFTTGTAVQSSVAYLSNGNVAITSAGRTLEFNVSVTATGFPFRFPDGSLLWVGGPDHDLVSFGGALPGPGNAAFGGGNDDAFDLWVFGGVAQGNQGNDTLSTSAQATLYGGQGDDQIITLSAAHDDFLQANKGDDSIQAGGQHDTALGGQGNDTIVASDAGGDYLDGNLGDDKLTGGGQLFGEDGNDTIAASSAQQDQLYGGGGNDQLTTTGGGRDLLDGGDGNDTLAGSSGFGGDTLVGGLGNDQVFVSNGRNSIDGGAGDDTINDNVLTGSEVDTVHGGAGDDVITALPGQSAQFDTLGPAHVIYGDEGDDRISLGKIGKATIDGGAGNDTLSAGAGAPFASVGNYAFGGEGNDSISGGLGSHMDGGEGNDTIQGAVHSDLSSQSGVFMTGGGGEDLFIFGVNSDLTPRSGGGQQAITDWSASDHLRVPGLIVDQINYSEMTASSIEGAANAIGRAAPNRVVAVQIGQDVVIFADAFTTPGQDNHSPLMLVGRTLADIGASNFI